MSRLTSLTCLCLILFTSVAYGMRKICYYTNWSQYRPGIGKYTPSNVEPYLCTHYIYAFATLQNNNVKAFEWNDLSTAWSKGMYERFNDDIKGVNPQAKTLLAVGGWNLGSGPFHALVATPQGRQTFAQSCIKFCRDNKFDGVDIDWEYPANRGSPPEDKDHYTELLQTVHDAFVRESQQTGKPRLMMTAAVAAGKPNIDTGYDIPAISRLLDFISVMTYDLHGSWEDHTGANSPLYSRAAEKGDDVYLNLDWAARYWVSKGAPKEKLNIGVAFFGRTFTLVGSDNSLGAPTRGAGNAGPYTREKGFLSYQEICEMRTNGGKVVDIPEQRVRYVTSGNQWVGYDDVKSIKEKGCYIKSNNFGGVMVWAMDLDDFSGTACNEGPYPLLNALVTEVDSSDRSNCVGRGTPVVQQTTHQPATTHAPGHQTPPTFVPHPTQSTVKPHQVLVTKDFNCYGRKSDFYASPNSCEEYYICANQMAFKIKCATGLRFNPVTKYCDRPSNVQCLIAVVTQAPVITQAPVTPYPTTRIPVTYRPITNKPSTTASPIWNPYSVANVFCRGKANGLYPVPNSCTKYYQCYTQIGFEHVCPTNKVFNFRIQACDFPYRVPGC